MSPPGPVDPDRVRRLLRQRLEMGSPPLLLEGDTRRAFLEALAGAPGRAGGGAGAAAPGTASAPPGGRASPRAPEPDAPAPHAPGPDAPAPGEGSAPAPDGRAQPADPAPATAGSAADLPTLPSDHDALAELASGCTRCGLAEGRTQVVFSAGNPEGRLMVVGEAPGRNEDETGLPFVGRAGQLLDLLLMSVDLSREEDVYICNVLKCRPPGNRNPLPAEIETCTPWLRRQIEVVSPDAILGVGTFAARFLTGTQQALGKLRGNTYSYEGVPVVVTYHPAALLRNPSWTRPTWDDLQLLRQILDRA